MYDALPQVVRFNRSSRVHLIGDETNRRFGRLVNHHLIDDYWKQAAAFGEVYEHHSSNPAPFERFCFQRWFVLQEFVESRGIDRFAYVDTDTMVYCDLAAEFTKFEGSDVALAYGDIDPEYVKASGCLSFWMTRAALADFCAYVMEVYRGTGDDLSSMVKQYRDRRVQNRPAAVNDMSAFGFFLESGRAAVTSSTTIINSAVHTRAFDDRRFECAAGSTLFHWLDGIPYARREADGASIRVCTHQCNGPTGKASMKRLRSKSQPDSPDGARRVRIRRNMAILSAQRSIGRVRSSSARILQRVYTKITRIVGAGE